MISSFSLPAEWRIEVQSVAGKKLVRSPIGRIVPEPGWVCQVEEDEESLESLPCQGIVFLVSGNLAWKRKPAVLWGLANSLSCLQHTLDPSWGLVMLFSPFPSLDCSRVAPRRPFLGTVFLVSSSYVLSFCHLALCPT